MDHTSVTVNPIQRHGSPDTQEPIPEWQRRMFIIRESMNMVMAFLAWLTFLALLGVVIWLIIRHG